MQIQANISALAKEENNLLLNAQKLAHVSQVIADPVLNEVSNELIQTITDRIPIIIAYEANAGVIKIQEEVLETLLDIKA
ncbi:MAG: hypothetical protein HRT40_09475 [Campylobacteraceae bacterium]|nr:hypothetical protein [Campylobacteraceae bacterium]